MTCCRTRSRRGFATLAAAVLCLSLGLMATAMLEASSLDLRASTSRLDRLKAEYALNGAQRLAAERLLADAPYGRARFSLPAPGGPFEVVAEPEAPKLALDAEMALSPAILQTLGVASSTKLRGALDQLARSPAPIDIASLDHAAAWQACGPSLISLFGGAAKFDPIAAQTPASGRFNWRAGEVWRMRLTDPGGWTDERWVRFTGDRRRPAATLIRDFRQSSPMGSRCDTYLG